MRKQKPIVKYRQQNYVNEKNKVLLLVARIIAWVFSNCHKLQVMEIIQNKNMTALFT